MENQPPRTNPGPDWTAPANPPPRSKRDRLLFVLQLVLSVVIAGGVLIYLAWPGHSPSELGERPTPPDEVVQVVGPRSIRVRPGTPLDSKRHVASVEAVWLTAPVLPVTGTTLASLRAGFLPAAGAGAAGLGASPLSPFLLPATLLAEKGDVKDAWQFATPELLTTFSDWNKAVTDIQFQETQLKAVRDLNVARIAAQTKVVARLEKLVAAGTDTEKDLAAERTNLIQFQIQGRKEIYEAETAVRLSRRTEATLARQLQQAGLEPAPLRSGTALGDLVVAEVPERMLGRVRLGMSCDVRFFAIPDRIFTGRVSSISPVISKEKRVLNVQFTVQDAESRIRPGMFAEIGLGTDKRLTLLMPADGVLHVGDRDFALVGAEPDTWQITPVEIGELRGTRVEVLSGLKSGERILGTGAILLKPVVVRALQQSDSTSMAVTAPKSDSP
jgi:cobalt-zinc-cadmium efflux system membrane fusion protein